MNYRSTEMSSSSTQIQTRDVNCIHSSISIYYQNVRGLRSKQKQFFANSSTLDYTIVVLTETWLNSTFFSVEYFNNSFVVYRTDRESTGSILQLGGGTLIAVPVTFASSLIKLDGFDDIELQLRST